MNIGIDAGTLCVPKESLKTGVFRINFELLKGLSKLDQKNNYLLYSFAPIDPKIFASFGNNFRNLVIKPKIGWSSFRLSLELLFHPVDLFLGLSQSLPFVHPQNSIVFIYDLAFKIFPKCYLQFKKLAWQSSYAIAKSRKIITISRSSQSDILKYYPDISRKKIEIIYPGGESILFKNKTKKIGITKPYLLFVGSLKPIKNISRLLDAYFDLSEKIKSTYQLVVVGNKEQIEENIDQKIVKLEKLNQVKYLGFVDDQTLVNLYKNAEVFISPSLYEGFGLPILEAMACGCPIIASNTGSMPEVIEDAGLLVNPLDTKDITKAMEKILTDKNLQKELRIKSLERSKNFSWQIFSQKVYNMIESTIIN